MENAVVAWSGPTREGRMRNSSSLLLNLSLPSSFIIYITYNTNSLTQLKHGSNRALAGAGRCGRDSPLSSSFRVLLRAFQICDPYNNV